MVEFVAYGARSKTLDRAFVRFAFSVAGAHGDFVRAHDFAVFTEINAQTPFFA
jgi:hypothetical protein